MKPHQIADLDIPKSLVIPLQRIAKHIVNVSNETRSDDGYWVFPKQGYTFNPGDGHAVHEYTVKDVISRVRGGPFPCDCGDCLPFLKEETK